MKFYVINTCLLLGLLLNSACIREEEPQNTGPLNITFGQFEADLEINGEVKIPIYFNKSLEAAQTLNISVAGTANEGVDYENIPRSFEVPAGVSQYDLSIKAIDNASEKIGKTIEITILEPENGSVREGGEKTVVSFVVTHTVNLDLWAEDIQFPILWAYSSGNADPVPPGAAGNANPHFAFAHKSRSQQNVIGLYNSEPERSTNALNMHRLYSEYNVSSGSANIRIEEFIRLIPESEGALEGTVEVIPQMVNIRRTESSGLPPFNIGISGSGTYSEETGSIEVLIYFDETEIGGESSVPRRYVFEAEQR